MLAPMLCGKLNVLLLEGGKTAVIALSSTTSVDIVGELSLIVVTGA